MTKRFDLVAEVFDYGEKVTKVAIDMGIDIFASTVDNDTFKVTNKSIKPTDGSVYYDGECEVTNVYVSHSIDGDSSTLGRYVILELNHKYQNPSTDTLYYDMVNDEAGQFNVFKSYNRQLDLSYEVKQNKDILIKEVVFMPIDTVYEFNKVIRPIADQFTSEVTSTNLVYRKFVPKIKAKKYPLIIWLHGSGEGGQNNCTHILSNQGAVAFASEASQNIFKGAYVVAPQCPDNWVVGSKDYTKDILTLIKEVVSTHKNINTKKIMLIGCSAGAKMVWQTLIAAPNLFSCVVPICGSEISDAEAKKVKHVPVWMVHSQNDEAVPYGCSVKNVQKLKALKGDVTLTSYNRVVYRGIEYNGHFSWIYALNNEPINNDGVSLFKWMSDQVKTDPHREAKIATAALGTAAVIGLGLFRLNKKRNTK